MKFIKKTLFYAIALVGIFVLMLVLWVAVAPHISLLVFNIDTGNWWFGSTKLPALTAAKPSAHFYGDTAASIGKIRIKVVYAVPKDKVGEVKGSLEDAVNSALSKTASFHFLQTRGLSKIQYEVFTEPVVLTEESSFYESTPGESLNHRGFAAVAEEIVRRIFKEDGDLYDESFARFVASEYPVLGIIYEGPGAAGGVVLKKELGPTSEFAKKTGLPETIVYTADIGNIKGFFLISRGFLTDAAYQAFGPTFLYHEFAHTIGLAERQDAGLPESDDVMGNGRREPIESAYIDQDILREVGIIQN